ncbi:hypothetical protein ACFWMG_07380 [Streptomyces sp. NPDC127074]|uniref:hypothetical protein n=1 Tax=Streptomyces sp. NPDC127074 TaxID=3347130 RepID=UPI003662C12D
MTRHIGFAGGSARTCRLSRASFRTNNIRCPHGSVERRRVGVRADVGQRLVGAHRGREAA